MIKGSAIRFSGKFEDWAKAAAKAILKFNQMIIDEICDIVPAIKPQAAYYENLSYCTIRRSL